MLHERVTMQWWSTPVWFSLLTNNVTVLVTTQVRVALCTELSPLADTCVSLGILVYSQACIPTIILLLSVSLCLTKKKLKCRVIV